MRKGLLGAAAVLAAVISLGSLLALRTRAVNQLHCLRNMKQLDDAAVSYCLEQRLSPTSMLSVAALSPYLKTVPTCPAGQSEYAPFSVLNGPACPNGHTFEPGVPRPFRARSSGDKRGGLYLAFGITNLIDRLEPMGAETRSQATRAKTN